MILNAGIPCHIPLWAALKRLFPVLNGVTGWDAYLAAAE